jgi:hypothetical protein
MAGSTISSIFAGKVLADATKFREVLAGRDQCRHLVREIADDARGVPVGAHAKGVGAVDLEQIGEAIKDPRHVGVMDRHPTACMSAHRAPTQLSPCRRHASRRMRSQAWPGDIALDQLRCEPQGRGF